MRFDEHFLKVALPEATIVHSIFPENISCVVDSRSLQPGDIFVALTGAHADGHDFLAHAIERGAAGLIIARGRQAELNKFDAALLKKMLVIVVADTRKALIMMAMAWRNHFTYPVVGITGSVGKTSTKEMLAHMLDRHGTRYLVSHGNQNTEIGLALNMLRMKPQHEVAIFEVGISKRGEMARLAHMLKPTTGIITGVGHCHMEGLGSLADIAQEKRDLFKYFAEDNIGVINGDQPLLADVAYVHPVVKFGSKIVNQVQARKVSMGADGISFMLKIYRNKYAVRVPLMHEGVISHVLAAAAMAHLLGVPDAAIIAAIENPVKVARRFEQRLLKNNRGFLIDDCYNANPESMKAALAAFERIDTQAQKIAVLGDMLELGINSQFWHRQLGRFLRKVPSLRQVILVGDMVKWTEKMLPVGVVAHLVPDWQEAAKKLQEQLGQDSLVLVKASRGIGLDKLVKEIAQ